MFENLLIVIGSALAFCILTAILYVIDTIVYKINPILGLIVTFFNLLLAPIGIIPVILIFRKHIKNHKKEADRQYAYIDEVTKNPSDENVDAFMAYVDSKGGISNSPQHWNTARGVWFIMNESPNVTTAKKRELRDWFMLKGLRLVGNDKNIIDNYQE